MVDLQEQEQEQKKEQEQENETKRWRRELDMRFEILKIQHEEVLAMHGSFEARAKRDSEIKDANLADMKSAIAHRARLMDAITTQTALIEREVSALDRIAGALELLARK